MITNIFKVWLGLVITPFETILLVTRLCRHSDLVRKASCQSRLHGGGAGVKQLNESCVELFGHAEIGFVDHRRYISGKTKAWGFAPCPQAVVYHVWTSLRDRGEKSWTEVGTPTDCSRLPPTALHHLPTQADGNTPPIAK